MFSLCKSFLHSCVKMAFCPYHFLWSLFYPLLDVINMLLVFIGVLVLFLHLILTHAEFFSGGCAMRYKSKLVLRANKLYRWHLLNSGSFLCYLVILICHEFSVFSQCSKSLSRTFPIQLISFLSSRQLHRSLVVTAVNSPLDTGRGYKNICVSLWTFLGSPFFL